VYVFFFSLSLYPHNKSTINPDGFVSVWNKGTPEYDGSVLAGEVAKLPFQEMFNRFVFNGEVPVDKRGNYQVNFGLACSKSKQLRTPESNRKYYGVAMPSVYEYTDEYIPLIMLCGVAWADPKRLAKHADVRLYFHLLHELFGDVRVFIGAFTWNALPAKNFVKEHVDVENGSPPLLGEVTIAQKILADSAGW
jgi:hypothetical protein